MWLEVDAWTTVSRSLISVSAFFRNCDVFCAASCVGLLENVGLTLPRPARKKMCSVCPWNVMGRLGKIVHCGITICSFVVVVVVLLLLLLSFASPYQSWINSGNWSRKSYDVIVDDGKHSAMDVIIMSLWGQGKGYILFRTDYSPYYWPGAITSNKQPQLGPLFLKAV